METEIEKSPNVGVRTSSFSILFCLLLGFQWNPS
jgi:hypothetical protein